MEPSGKTGSGRALLGGLLREWGRRRSRDGSAL